MSGLRGVGAWPGPALVAGTIAAIAAGAAAAPVLLLAVTVAPLLALMQPPRAPTPRHPVALAIAAVVAALLLWAHLAALADAATLLGARRWQATALAAALGLLVTLLPRAARGRDVALLIGGGGLVFVLVAVASGTGRPPWTAWSDAAARPALVFTRRSPWVADGERVLRQTTLAFEEGQRVTAVVPGRFRVVEVDGVRPVVRDWRLAAGDAMALRPGDTLTADAGSRLRFEAGKRVPGALASGSAWADATTRTSPWDALALLITVALGACALIPAAHGHVVAASGIVLSLALGLASWAGYVTLGAPEAGLGGSPLEAVLALPRIAPSAHGMTPGVLTAITAVALLGLFVAAADRLRETVAEAGGRRWPEVWTAAMAVATMAATVPSVSPWMPLLAGLGLAGAAIAAPRMVARDARIGPWPGSVIGGLVGAVVFVALSALGAQLPARLAVLSDAPVVVAAPAAWLVVKLLRRERPPAR